MSTKVSTPDNNNPGITEVVFRKWRSGDKEVIALFPYENEGNYKCSSYMHVGQHGAADYNVVMSATRPATEAEYIDLQVELISKPYNYQLKVIKRRSHKKWLESIKRK